MLVNVYSLHDSKALVYSPPFLAGQHGLACRMVQELSNDLTTSVGRHPADFTLYCIGTFDDQSGQLLPAPHREHISDVVALSPQRPVIGGLFEDAARKGYFDGAGKDYFPQPNVEVK